MKFGTMATDFEVRVDFERLRREREEKVEKAMAESDADALLLFDQNNIRYATNTWTGEWARDKLGRYAIVPRGGKSLLFDFGSAVASKKLHSPWIKDRVFPMSSWMRNSVPYEAGFQDEFNDTLVRILKDHGIENARVGIDIIDYRALEVLQKNGFTIVDGQEIMLDARVIKTQDEIYLLEGAASMVDAAYGTVVRNLRRRHPRERACRIGPRGALSTGLRSSRGGQLHLRPQKQSPSA